MRSLLLTLMAFSAATALAEQDGPVTFTAGYALQTDSNLFRLPSGFKAKTGESVATEQIGVTTVGLGFATTQSLQRFELDASLVDYRYQHFDYLNFTATNVDAAWHWSLTPQLTGNLTGTRKETYNTFIDYQSYTERNRRTNTNSHLDMLYELNGPWHLLAGMTQADQRNELAVLVGGGESRSTGAEMGLRYHYGSGSTIAVVGKVSNGSYIDRTVPNTDLYDDSYKQLDTRLQLHWVYSGSTTLDGSLSQINRSHPNYAQRDYNGLNVEARVNWALSGKTTIKALYTRGLEPYARADSNYMQIDRLQLGTVWVIGPKTQLTFNQIWTNFDFLGSPGATSSQRHDLFNDSSLSVGWDPLPHLRLTAGLQTSSRASTQANLDFDSTMVNLAAQYSY